MQMIEEWNAKKKELDEQLGREQLEDGVESWDPSKPKGNQLEEKKGGEEDEEITALVEVDETIVEINRMEEEYLKEYEALVEKDKADGKDFNKLRHDIMVDA